MRLEDLVAEADTEDRLGAGQVDRSANVLDGGSADLGVTRTVGQEQTIRLLHSQQTRGQG